MTGYSHSWDHNKKLLGGVMLISGIFLLIEHLFTHGGYDIELLGHEWYGIALILGAVLLNIKYKQIPVVIQAFKERNLKKIFDEGER